MKKSSGRRGDKTPLRRLERRDAAKHINYDPDSSSSSLSKHLSFSTYSRWLTRRVTVKQTNDDAVSSSSSSSKDFSVSTDSFMTPSMEFPDRTSFRILGGEDRIYKSIGVSGPEDLAISFDAWEASKKRSSSDLINGLKSFKLHGFSEAGPSGEANNDTELRLYESRNGGLEGTPTITRGYLVNPDSSDVVAVVVGGGRPPRLKPPPAKRPPIDHQGSSWDFVTHFAPKSEIVRRPSSSSSSDNGEEALEEEVERVVKDETMFSSDSSSIVSVTWPIYANGGAIITSWQKGGLLGRGSFASVYEGISGDGDFFAVKEVSLLEQGSQARECIQQLEVEIALLSQLQHQNIVRYRGTDKDGSNLYIFLELVSQGSLLKLYQRYQLRDSVVSTYTRQILDGLKYLHDEGFIHRDIKCANILVDASGAVKLADFGLAEVSKFNDLKSCKGTPFWMAPEVINPKRTDGYGSSADIWSLGCTVLEMLTGRIPYWDSGNAVQALFRIGRGVPPDIPETLSIDARDFIIKCLKLYPGERPTAAELLNHPFVRRRPLSSSG